MNAERLQSCVRAAHAGWRYRSLPVVGIYAGTAKPVPKPPPLASASPLVSIPCLDELLRVPNRASALPVHTLTALMASVAAVQSTLAAEFATRGDHRAEPEREDRLLTPEQAAIIICEEPRWFYRRRLSFIHRINRRKILISETGLRRWIASRKSG